MANTTNVTLTTKDWELVATSVSGSISNGGAYDIEICESDTAPTIGKGSCIQPKEGLGFALTAGQSLYAKSSYNNFYVLTLE